MKRNNKKGFTIVELVIVIAVIAILATVLVPTFGNIIDKANNSKLLQTLKNEYTEYVISVSDGKDTTNPAATIYVLYNESYYKVENGNPSTVAEAAAPTTAGSVIWDAANNTKTVVTAAPTT